MGDGRMGTCHERIRKSSSVTCGCVRTGSPPALTAAAARALLTLGLQMDSPSYVTVHVRRTDTMHSEYVGDGACGRGAHEVVASTRCGMRREMRDERPQVGRMHRLR